MKLGEALKSISVAALAYSGLSNTASEPCPSLNLCTNYDSFDGVIRGPGKNDIAGACQMKTVAGPLVAPQAARHQVLMGAAAPQAIGAAFSALAASMPAILASRMTDNGDGTDTFKLGVLGENVLVDRAYPVDKNDNICVATSAKNVGDDNFERWPAALYKAYSTWINEGNAYIPKDVGRASQVVLNVLGHGVVERRDCSYASALSNKFERVARAGFENNYPTIVEFRTFAQYSGEGQYYGRKMQNIGLSGDKPYAVVGFSTLPSGESAVSVYDAFSGATIDVPSEVFEYAMKYIEYVNMRPDADRLP